MSMFRRVYLAVVGPASGVAIVASAASLAGLYHADAVPFIGVLFGLGLAAIGGAFSFPEKERPIAEYEAGA